MLQLGTFRMAVAVMPPGEHSASTPQPHRGPAGTHGALGAVHGPGGPRWAQRVHRRAQCPPVKEGVFMTNFLRGRLVPRNLKTHTRDST